jgi:hypothetical protein
MFDAVIYNAAETGDVTGDVVSVTTKTTVIGLCTVEIIGNTDPDLTITLQGKLRHSSDAAVDSGWVDVVEFSKLNSVGGSQVVGKAIGIFTFMRAKILNNSSTANIQITVGFN